MDWTTLKRAPVSDRAKSHSSRSAFLSQKYVQIIPPPSIQRFQQWYQIKQMEMYLRETFISGLFLETLLAWFNQAHCTVLYFSLYRISRSSFPDLICFFHLTQPILLSLPLFSPSLFLQSYTWIPATPLPDMLSNPPPFFLLAVKLLWLFPSAWSTMLAGLSWQCATVAHRNLGLFYLPVAWHGQTNKTSSWQFHLVFILMTWYHQSQSDERNWLAWYSNNAKCRHFCLEGRLEGKFGNFQFSERPQFQQEGGGKM